MSTPEKLADHAKHILEAGKLRDFLIRLGSAVDALNTRCACVNVLTPNDDGIDDVDLDETDIDQVL